MTIPWTPLGDLAGSQLRAAPLILTALMLDRPTRDRLVIFDPTSVHLIRPLVAVEDLAPWHVGMAGRWVIAIPHHEDATVQRFTALMRHLDGLAAPPTLRKGATAQRDADAVEHAKATSGDDPAQAPWWLLDPATATSPAAPRIIVGGDPPVVAWDDGPGLISGPAQVVASADPSWLALLGSPLGHTLLAECGGDLANFPVPVAPAPVVANLGALALSAANLARQLDELERAVLKRLLADFGPPGVGAGPLLRRWWSLDFEGLRAAVLSELRNDIPERFRATWAQIHADEQATHQQARLRLAKLEEVIAGQVQGLYDVS
ncbi:MAG: hypothetical protein AB4911_00205 [Oscillochloridaceae bacterium umkhey_bin13]